jgi:hypothetical protein
MLLNELLNTQVPITIVTNTPKMLGATFVAANMEYSFEAALCFKTDDDDPDNLWLVQFSPTEGPHKNSSYKTGTGDQFKVFAAIKQLMARLVQEKIVSAGKGGILFEGTTMEPARLKLYRRFANSLLSQPNWRIGDGNQYEGWIYLLYNQ